MSVDDGEEASTTFADVFNGLTAGRSRRQQASRHRQEPAVTPVAPVAADQAEASEEEAAASVRAYAWTGGRVRVSTDLEIETLISTTARGEELIGTMRSEHQAVARLCRQSRSVAEIAALLSLPLGVVRVLLDDMAGLCLVTVHSTPRAADGEPDMALLHRVLRGLTQLRT